MQIFEWTFLLANTVIFSVSEKWKGEAQKATSEKKKKERQ
jgi:hypothetical protein